MEKFFKTLLLLLVISVPSFGQGSDHFQIQSGMVYFKSDAPLEMIEAESKVLQGVIDPVKNTFAFKIDINSFNGFNSPLQQVHFNENYMDSERFPDATFTGKIIEKIDLSEDGTYTIRTKGKLTIHGVTTERIIKSILKVTEGKLELRSRFPILLNEHDIEVPRVVHQKIAEEISVEVEAFF